MFGIGTFTLILMCTFMGPTVALGIVAIVIAFVSSLLITAYRAELSDASLSQDLGHINTAFDTDALLSTTWTKNAGPRRRNYSKLFYKTFQSIIGPGTPTRMYANPPIHASISSAWQAMRVLDVVANVKGATASTAVKVLEVTLSTGHCTYAMASIVPQEEYEFHIFDFSLASKSTDLPAFPNVHHQQSNIFQPAVVFDVIFAVESANHFDTTDRMREFMAKMARCLAPHGRIVLIDGFRSELFASAPPDQQLAMRLAERALNTRQLHSMSEWFECAYRAGLTHHRVENRTALALPHWTVGWRLSHSIIAHAPAWLIRRLHASPYTSSATNNLLAFATAAHAMRDSVAGVYGVVEFVRM